MDKYPLIGVSICAVVLLVLGSLSNVVGYQSHSTPIQISKNSVRDDNDTTPPVTTIYFHPSEPNGKNGWYITNIRIELAATDDISGVDFIKYLLDDNDWMLYTSPLMINSSGYHRITYYAVDKAGNVEQPSEMVRFKLDNTAPVVEMNYTCYGNAFQGYGFIFTVTATDAMSGMDYVEFYFNEYLQETVTGAGPNYTWSCLRSPCITQIYKGVAYDKAGRSDFRSIENPTSYENQQNQSQSKTVVKEANQ